MGYDRDNLPYIDPGETKQKTGQNKATGGEISPELGRALRNKNEQTKSVKMGRYGTGIATTKGSKRIELKHLLKAGYIRKGLTSLQGSLSWVNASGEQTGTIGIQTAYTDQEKYIRLTYTVTTGEGEKIDQDYKIYLEEKPSNLGRGSVLYFLCPESFNYCRVLYLAYGAHRFKSRQAYRHRIYYPLQTSSKLDIYNDRFFSIEDKLEKLNQGRASYEYKGKTTRKRQRINRLEKQQEEADYLRFTRGMGKRLGKTVGLYRLLLGK
jgi:hypothetical protein